MNANTLSRWDEYPVLDVAESAPSGWRELPDNGWGALVAWFAGPARVMRQLDTREHLSIETCVDANGMETRDTQPRTERDWRIITETVDQYLGEASIPPRPGRYRWFLQLPQGMTEDQFWEYIGDRTRVEPYVPQRIAEAMRDALVQLF